jgi:predicted short-subunit dehydrogenase-like oxidoreductase (DUF2520 family)
METYQSGKLIIMGAGNLAWHLGPALRDAGYPILQVFSRTELSARALAERLDAAWTTDPGQLTADADILLFCLPDRVIPELLCRVELKKRPMMVHTAGSVPADVFKGICVEYGVLYPFMTFSKDRSMDFRSVPVCIEGNTPACTDILEKMAGRISNRISRMNSEERKILHLAGVFACNFSNHMYHLSQELLTSHGMDFNIVKPLITETASKVILMDPEEAQTGPASRKDSEVVSSHIELLNDHPELQKLYTFVSDSITNHFRSS